MPGIAKPAPNRPMKPNVVDLNKVVYDKMKKKVYKTGNDSKQAKMSYTDDAGTKVGFRIQTPMSKVPFEVSDGTKKKKDGEEDEENDKDEKKPKFKKYSLDFRVEGNPELLEFKNFLLSLDEKNVQHIVSQSQEWWGKKMSEDSVRDLGYSSMIKSDDKKEHPDRFRLKLPMDFDGLPLFKVYDENDKKIQWVTKEEGKPPVLDWSWAKKDMHIETLMECEGLWIVDRKVYCTFKALQIRVYPPEDLEDCAFDNSGREQAEIKEVKPKSVKETKETKSATKDDEADLKVEDDDDDEEEVAEEEEDDDEEYEEKA